MQSNFGKLSDEDYKLIRDLTNIAFNYFHQFRSILLHNHGFDGKLYRENEHALIHIDDKDYLAQLSNFICVLNESEASHFIICDLYEYSSFDEYSGHGVYSSVCVARMVIKPVNILRKVMVWETLNGDFLAVDYDRSVLPISSQDILVPVYAKVGDMVKIQGENEYYFAHVVAVDYKRNAVSIYYYEISRSRNNRLIKCKYPRETIEIDSIVSLCEGTWDERKTYFDLQ